jgi:hypothetical protein
MAGRSRLESRRIHSTADRQQLCEAVDQLLASELDAALRYLRFSCLEGREEEPLDDETVNKLKQSETEGGESVSLDEVERRYGL